jgi:glutamyl-Q tRNA(Asp) synthetase
MWGSCRGAVTASDAAAQDRPVTRFAPSPTGYLHRGHAFSALTAHDQARRRGGRFLLRIEDIDSTRCRPGFTRTIFEDLAWLGLDWEHPVRRQSDHLADYRDALAKLRERGVLYRCFRTRAEILANIGAAPHETWRAESLGPLPPAEEAERLAAGEPFAWRLSLSAAERHLGGFAGLGFEEHGAGPAGETGWIAADPRGAGDIIVARKDLGVSYHLAVVADDALQGITEVVRGEDLFAATPVQRLLQALLDLPAPAYRHHRLILRPDGKRFAKRDTTETLRELRGRGVTSDQLRQELGLGR